MKKQSNAERVIYNFINNCWYNTHKNDAMRLTSDNEVYDRNTKIGEFIETYDEAEGMVFQFLVLTLQNWKSQSNWKTHKKQLAYEANQAGIFVVFVKEFATEFGNSPRPEIDMNSYMMDNEQNNLIEVAKYSQDDIKTACCAGILYVGPYFYTPTKPIVYTYNQDVTGDGYTHAEEILYRYLDYYIEDYNDLQYYDLLYLYSLLEPCEDCLRNAIHHNSPMINFGHKHKEKWNTDSYYNLLDQIQAKDITLEDNRPIRYNYLPTDTIDKFYNKGEQK